MVLPRAQQAARPMTAREIEAVARGRYGAANGLVQRLLATIRVLQAAEQQVTYRAFSGLGDREQTWQTREKVLLVVQPDGWAEVYAEPWTDCRVVELWPGEDDEAAIRKLPECYRILYWPYKKRGAAFPTGRRAAQLSELDGLTMEEVYEALETCLREQP